MTRATFATIALLAVGVPVAAADRPTDNVRTHLRAPPDPTTSIVSRRPHHHRPTNVVDQPDSPFNAASFGCCAGVGDGTFYANTSTVGSAWGVNFFHAPGYTAADPVTEQFIAVIGDSVPTSKAGMYVTSIGGVFVSIAWNPISCTVRQIEGAPRMCMGGADHAAFPIRQPNSHIDLLTPQLHFSSLSGSRTIAVSPLSCMPYHMSATVVADSSVNRTNAIHYIERPAIDPAPGKLGRTQRIGDASASGSIVTLFRNGTSWRSFFPKDIFAFPSWCAYDPSSHTDSSEK